MKKKDIVNKLMALGMAALVALDVAAVPNEAKNPTTVCNPIDLEYMFHRGKARPDGKLEDLFVESADPALCVFKGEYWLFASKGEGYWHSKDMGKWTFVKVDITKPVQKEFLRYAPATCVIGDTLYLIHSEGGRVIKTKDPADPEAWEDVGHPVGCSDPGWLYDDPATGGDGYVYLYRGLSHRDPIEVFKLDPKNDMKVVEGPYFTVWPDMNNRGFEVAGDDNTLYQNKDTQEGPWPVKYNGKYYLTCAVPGTQYASYADNCYVADHPFGPFRYCWQSPVAWKATGFTQGAGHGCLTQDLNGHWWKVDTCRTFGFDRRLVLLPAMFDEKGDLYTNTVRSDYPFFIPGRNKRPFDVTGPAWELLSVNKPATASSNAREADRAFDENVQTCWIPKTDNPGEWLAVDLGTVCEIRSLQMNFANKWQKLAGGRDVTWAWRYVLEFSEDGRTWRTLLDRRAPKACRQHEYVEFERPVRARHVRYVNKSAEIPGGCRLAVSALRVFGTCAGAKPAPVAMDKVVAERMATDNRMATLSWPAVPGAQGYIIRYGLAPDKLHTHFQVLGKSELTMRSLNRGVDYYYTIDAFGMTGLTRGKDVKKLPATEALVEGYDPDQMNPAVVNQAKVVAVHEAEKASFGGKDVKVEYACRASQVKALQGFGATDSFALFKDVESPREAGTVRLSYAALKPAKLKLILTNADPKAREVRKPVEKIVELPPTWGWTTFGTTDVTIDRVNAKVDIRIEGVGEPFALDWVQFINKPKGR